MSELVKTVVHFSDVGGELVFTQATGSDYYIPANADGRVTLLIKNANAQNAAVTLKAGNGVISGLGDVTIPVGAAKTVAVPFAHVESARVKWIDGANKGQVLVSESVDAGGSLANLSVAVLSVE